MPLGPSEHKRCWVQGPGGTRGAAYCGFNGLIGKLPGREAVLHVPVIGIIRLKRCQRLIQERIMSSFETQRRLTAVNACANVVDFTGGREALTAQAPSPPHALVQWPGLLSSPWPWPQLSSSSAATARAS